MENMENIENPKYNWNLKDIFEKYVLLPAGYWEYVRYTNANLEFNFFNIENSKIHIYTLSDMRE